MTLFRSLQSRLLAGLVVGTTLILATNGVVIYLGAKRSLVAEVDESLAEILKSNIAEITRQTQPLDEPRGRPPSPFPRPIERGEFTFQCWDPAGRVVLRSQHLGDGSLPRLAAGFPVISYQGIEAGVLYFESIELPDGSGGRAVALCFEPPPPNRPEGRPPPRQPEGPRPQLSAFELVIAQETAAVDEMLRLLSWLLLIAWASSSAGCALILALLVRRGLRPLDRLRAELDEVDVDELDQRFELPDAPAELQPVIDELNGLLARVRRAFERERSFSADVAHELRTPIAGLRTTLEVFLDRDRDADEGRETADRCLAITLEMQGVVEVLLEMVGGSGADENDRWEEVAPGPLVTDCLQGLTETTRERGARFENRLAPGLVVRTDPRLLRRILANLLENALLYGNPAEPIEIRGTRDGEATRLVVENALLEPCSDLAERAFEAFWRADPSRRDTGRHAGLGLPLCRKIAERLGATLEANVTTEHFIVTLTLPRGEESG